MPTPLALARQIAHRTNLNPVMIAPQADFAADLIQLSQTSTAEENARVVEARVDLVAMYGIDGYAEKPFAFANGIAVIPVHGSLINRFTRSWGFVTGYNFIQNQLRAALDDGDVKAIIFDCNSPGGEVNGLFETADEIYLSRGQKPLVAMIDTASYSACYAIASSCDRIILTPSGGVGSIGAMCMHVSYEKMLDEAGIKVTPIYSGTHKVDGTPYKDLPESVRAEIQVAVDASRGTFVSLVARNRAMEEQVIFATEAACYRATEALEMGLVDDVMTPSQAAIRLINELNGSPETEDEDMPTAEELAAAQSVIAAAAAKPAVAAAAPAAPVVAAAPAAAAPAAAAPDAAALQKAERERCMGITGCDEAKGKEALASHIAFNTSMSVEEAKGMLAAAPVGTVAAAPAAAANDHFKQAMDNGSQPNVGADGQPLVAGEEASKGNPLLEAYASVHGKALG